MQCYQMNLLTKYTKYCYIVWYCSFENTKQRYSYAVLLCFMHYEKYFNINFVVCSFEYIKCSMHTIKHDLVDICRSSFYLFKIQQVYLLHSLTGHVSWENMSKLCVCQYLYAFPIYMLCGLICFYKTQFHHRVTMRRRPRYACVIGPWFYSVFIDIIIEVAFILK
jgi:hypothetical protein